MEHNEYSVWEVVLDVYRPVFESNPGGDSTRIGDCEVRATIHVVAPGGELGQKLLPIYLKRTYEYGGTRRPDWENMCYRVISITEKHKVSGVVRYEDAYRARF